MYTCVKCGKQCGDEAERRKMCFNCNFWTDLALHRTASNMVRIDGTHYMIGTEEGPASCKGFNGKRFKIKFDDGRVVETTNLWHQGVIPQLFRDLLPNNATFGDL